MAEEIYGTHHLCDMAFMRCSADYRNRIKALVRSRLALLIMALCATVIQARPAHALPIAIFNTSLGSFQVQLRPDVAPLTVQNFLDYVDRGAYDDTVIHRALAGFVVQGGGFSADSAPFTASHAPAPIPTDPPVQNEFHLPNITGTIAMAKLGGNPNSATSQWFFNLVDNSSSLDQQNGGYTVFGNVLGNGMNILSAIAALPSYTIGNFWGANFTNVPLVNLTPGSPQLLASNFILVNSITVAAPEPATLALLLTGSALTFATLVFRRQPDFKG